MTKTKVYSKNVFYNFIINWMMNWKMARTKARMDKIHQKLQVGFAHGYTIRTWDELIQYIQVELNEAFKTSRTPEIIHTDMDDYYNFLDIHQKEPGLSDLYSSNMGALCMVGTGAMYLADESLKRMADDSRSEVRRLMWRTKSLFGAIHYYTTGIANMCIAMAIQLNHGKITTGFIASYITYLVAHERHHATQQVDDMVNVDITMHRSNRCFNVNCTNEDMLAYHGMKHESQANRAAYKTLCEFTAMEYGV